MSARKCYHALDTSFVDSNKIIVRLLLLSITSTTVVVATFFGFVVELSSPRYARVSAAGFVSIIESRLVGLCGRIASLPRHTRTGKDRFPHFELVRVIVDEESGIRLAFQFAFFDEGFFIVMFSSPYRQCFCIVLSHFRNRRVRHHDPAPVALEVEV